MTYESEAMAVRVKERLTTQPLPSGTLAQRDLGDLEVLFEFLVSSTHPTNSDMILSMVSQHASQGNEASIDQLWIVNAFGKVARSKLQGERVDLQASSLSDDEAARIIRHSLPIHVMYARLSDEGTFELLIDALRQTAQGGISPLPPLPNDPRNLVPRDMSDDTGAGIAFRLLRICERIKQAIADYA